jgi:hypothetical protein
VRWANDTWRSAARTIIGSGAAVSNISLEALPRTMLETLSQKTEYAIPKLFADGRLARGLEAGSVAKPCAMLLSRHNVIVYCVDTLRADVALT